MRRLIVAFTFVALPVAATLGAAQSARPAAAPAGVELDALDRAADPCTDFYQFACGGWVAKNPLPADRRSWGRFQEVQDRNFTILRRILEAPGNERPEGDRKKASDFYAACMDEPGIEANGLAPLGPELATINALSNPDDLPVLVAHLHGIGVQTLFRFGSQTDLRDATQQIADVDQSGLGLPDRETYLKTDTRSAEQRGQYVAHVEKMFTLAGIEADRAAAEAKAVLALETAMAKAMLGRVERRNPSATQHPMTPVDLQALTPSFDWKKYVAASQAPEFHSINVSVPDYMKALDALIASTPVTDLKAYLRWHLLHASADLLPKRFADANFDFFSRTLNGQQAELPRWRRCVGWTDDFLGEALGKAFVEEAFGPQAKADMLKMVQGIKDAMRQDIDAAPWMSGETKKAAMVKLDAVVDRIGYPDTWRDYSALRVTRDDALGNEQRALAWSRERNLKKIGQPVDRSEWGMTPPTVNAYYSPDRNNINFPAGILQPPFYRAGRDAAVNYGGAGAVIGHELTHGFDDQGRRFDGQGNLRDWWTAADGKAFEERANCVADQYSSYTVAGDTHINGRLTLGENTADNGGLRLALMAYLAGPGAKAPKVDGFTGEQRVFIGWAQVWCENARPEAERLKAATNPHSSNKYRVNGPLSNMPEFRKAFSCKQNAPMVRQNACRVW
ncbi:MAG: M13 family metallopeptidase [Acidobacteriia bacterium]|nr:M13 family metallopeptidase [Terriglobia bacterium]